MKKLFACALLLVGFAYAETMPAGSPQREITERLAGDLLGAFTLTPCPPELEVPSVQAACGVWEGGNATNFTRLLDVVVKAYNDEVRSVGADRPTLTPLTRDWFLDIDYGRYEKTYSLSRGEYRVVFAPINPFIGQVVIFYNDGRLPADTL